MGNRIIIVNSKTEQLNSTDSLNTKLEKKNEIESKQNIFGSSLGYSNTKLN